MADQDFKVNIVTTADTRGARQVGEDLDKIARRQSEAEVRWLRSPLNPKNQTGGGPTPPGGDTAGGIASAVGIGTIISLLTGAITKWKQFSDEQDKIIDKMFEATARMREEALAVAAIKDLDFSEDLIKQADSVEQLQGNYGRLTQKISTLKGEQDALDPLTQAKEWKELRTEINAYEAQLRSVQSTLQQKGVKDFVAKTPGPKAGIGESQALVDEIERNRKAAEDQLKEDVWDIDPVTGGYRRTGQKRFPLFQAAPTAAPPPDWTTGAGKIGGQPDWKALFKQAFEESMSKYWGP